MTIANDENISKAIITRAFNLGVVPQSTLTVGANPGAQIISVTATKDTNGQALFVAGGLLHFFDGSVVDGSHPDYTMNASEPPVAIQSVDYNANHITLDYGGTPWGLAGCAVRHDAGAVVSTNLAWWSPNNTTPSLNAGYPFISAVTWRESSHSRTMPAIAGGIHRLYTTVLLYEALVQRPNPKSGVARLDTNIFAATQQENARTNLETMKAYFIGDQEFRINGNIHAIRLGHPGQTDGALEIDWSKFQVNKETWQLAVPMVMKIWAAGTVGL